MSSISWALSFARASTQIMLEVLTNLRHNLISRVPSWDPEQDMPELEGRVAIVTGGNAGLGRASVEALVRGGATVYMASRNREKAMKVIDEIKTKIPRAKLHFLQLDLASLASTKKAAEEFLSKETQLHILLNNAGIEAYPIELTSDNLEIQWQTNHISHFLFTKLLLPTLLRTAETAPAGTVRIVNVSSVAHRMVLNINYEDIALTASMSLLAPTFRYGQSKLANLLHAKALAKRYGEKIICVAVHPGVCATGLHQTVSDGNPVIVWGLIKPQPYMLVPADGALTQIWAATSPQLTLQGDNGKFYCPFMVENTPSAAARDEGEVERLWEYTEKLLEEKGY